MSCNPAGLSELPGGPSVTTGIIIIRECLQVNGVDVDGIVHHDATLTGTGQVTSPLSVVAGGAAVFTDNVTIQGDGTNPDKIRIKAVQSTGMTGNGAVGTPLNCVTVAGIGGTVDTSIAGGVSVNSVDPGNVAIQAQNSAFGAGIGIIAITSQGGAGGAGAGITKIGTVSGGAVQLGQVATDIVQMNSGFFDVKALAASPGVSPAGYVRFWYDSTAGLLKVSINGAAFVAVVTL